MNITIKNGSLDFTVNIEKLTQLCGFDIIKKDYIIDSIYKHFSLYKYNEYEENMIDNVLINGEKASRSDYICFYIDRREDLISQFKLTKQSILSKIINTKLQLYNFNNEINELSIAINNLYEKMNNLLPFENIKFSYDIENISEIGNEMKIVSIDEEDVSSISNYELLISFLKILGDYNQSFNVKTILVVKNIDHLINKEEYLKIVDYISEEFKNKDIIVISTISLPNYAIINKETVLGLNVINDIIFQFPEVEIIESFINNYYPINMNCSFVDIEEYLKRIVHYIGSNAVKYGLKWQVLLKMFNNSLKIDVDNEIMCSEIEKKYIYN